MTKITWKQYGKNFEESWWVKSVLCYRLSGATLRHENVHHFSTKELTSKSDLPKHVFLVGIGNLMETPSYVHCKKSRSITHASRWEFNYGCPYCVFMVHSSMCKTIMIVKVLNNNNTMLIWKGMEYENIASSLRNFHGGPKYLVFDATCRDDASAKSLASCTPRAD